MSNVRGLAAIAVTALSTMPALAAIEVQFIEGAPKDRFVIENTGQCPLPESRVLIDLAKSTGRLIFDTSGSGAGVDVFQPFEVAAGTLELAADGRVEDGDSKLALRMGQLSAGASAAFTIDVDDTLPAGDLGNSRISDAEIEGGSVRIEVEGRDPVVGVFGSDGKVRLATPECGEPPGVAVG